jgi:NTE family protein
MAEPKIGLALGSGGARGLAHIGVLKVLERENIPISMIAGSSIGSLVAAFYASGQNIDTMVRVSQKFKRKYFIDFTIPKLGFIAGNRIKEFIRVFTYQKRIEDLNLPLAIIATDLHTGEKVIFRTGDVAEAVRASISIPGIFIPETYQGRLLVDGGVSDRVPVSVVKEMGADLVIAVDVAGLKKNAEIITIYDVILQSIDIMQVELAEARALQSDIYIRPPVEKYSSYAFSDIDEMILKGEEATEKVIPKIKQMIGMWEESYE